MIAILGKTLQGLVFWLVLFFVVHDCRNFLGVVVDVFPGSGKSGALG